MQSHLAIILFFVLFGLGILIGLYLRKKMVESKIESIDKLSQRIIEEARKEAETVKKDAMLQTKDALFRMKMEFEKETKDQRGELQKLEKRLSQKEENLEKKEEVIFQREQEAGRREQSMRDREKHISAKEKEYQALLEEEKKTLERLAGVTSTEAKNMLLQAMENEARHEGAKMVRQIENEAQETADKRSKDILALAVKRYSGDYIMEKAVCVVNLPNEEMKGRIIGREGRNIRALEAATGVDLIIDDTPEAVILSAFNPVRREVAKLTLERLINDGRIHPARIEEVVKKTSQEVETTIRETGEQATFDVGAHGVAPELQRLIGKLKFRSSYGQNALQHSLEVAFLCGVMASELNLNVKQAKRAGLLHDIGKAVDHEIEGSHAAIGADLLRKYGEVPKIVHAVAAHHEEVQAETTLDILVQAADTLSGARPGARREMLETYVKRLADLERIANQFKGVEKSYAIQAGRELRIIVESDKISDDESLLLCRDISRKIEKELVYPGQIKVTVIRETRAVDFAK